MKNKVIFEADKEDLIAAFKEVRQDEIKAYLTDKWENRTVDAKAFCQIHGISLKTLYRYVEEGRVVPINSESGKKLLFQLSYVLSLELSKFKHTQFLRSNHLVSSKS